MCCEEESRKKQGWGESQLGVRERGVGRREEGNGEERREGVGREKRGVGERLKRRGDGEEDEPVEQYRTD